MKLKIRGIFLLTCCVILCVMLFINYKVNEWKSSNEVSHLDNVIRFQNGGHLQVLRKDLDKSNYQSEALKSENLNADALLEKNSEINKDLDSKSATDSFEESVMRTIRDAIHRSKVFKKKESLLKLVEVIKQQANNTHFGESGFELFPTKKEEPFRIAWFGKKGNFSEKLNLTPREVDYLKRIKPYKRRFKNSKAKVFPLYKDEETNLTTTRAFHKQITQYELYQTKDPLIDRLLRDLNTLPIVGLKQHEGGTQIKFVLTLSDGSRAMFKPMRFPRERETLPNHFYWSDFERHTSEIAAFHLDRVLGFHRIPPTVGRVVNLTTEIRRFADDDLEATFFHSPAGNLCFYGACDYYCDSSHAVCGYPDFLEGSMMSYLPSTDDLPRKTWRNPWKRTYSKHKKAEWERNPKYCEKIRRRSPYNRGRRLLDVMDMAVFDFLSGNLDRHHYETFSSFGNFTMPLHLDNGRAFGRPRFDDLSIIAPVSQCCLIRYSTFIKLLHFHSGPLTLSEAMRASLARDPINPVLIEKHLTSLDRRVKIILKILNDCMKKSAMPFRSVIDDGF